MTHPFFAGILYGICLFVAIFGNHVGRLRRVVCAAYYPAREQVRSPHQGAPAPSSRSSSPSCHLRAQERTAFLYNTILARRAGLVRALRKAARMNSGDAAQGNLLLFLTSRQVSLLCASLGTAGAR